MQNEEVEARNCLERVKNFRTMNEEEEENYQLWSSIFFHLTFFFRLHFIALGCQNFVFVALHFGGEIEMMILSCDSFVSWTKIYKTFSTASFRIINVSAMLFFECTQSINYVSQKLLRDVIFSLTRSIEKKTAPSSSNVSWTSSINFYW